MTLLLVLIVLTGCRSTGVEPAVSNSQIIREMAPELPELPQWPQLKWEYRDGWYCLSESDVDKLLDYRENRIPLYQSEIEIYKQKMKIILDHLE